MLHTVAPHLYSRFYPDPFMFEGIIIAPFARYTDLLVKNRRIFSPPPLVFGVKTSVLSNNPQ